MLRSTAITPPAPCLATADPVRITWDVPGVVVPGQVPADHGPGANGVVVSIAEDLVTLACDRRGAAGTQQDHDPWFWFYVRIHPGGRSSVRLAIADPIAQGVTNGGVAVSSDDGATWGWNGSPGPLSTIAVPPGAGSLLVALAPPYTDDHWRAFLDRLGSAAPRERVLATIARGRPVPLAELGVLQGARRRVLINARIHACEVTSSAVLEGFLETVAKDPAWSRRRDDTLVQAVPFMDRDGVELGEQGKGRKPHDHNRDFSVARRIYPETRALIALARDPALPPVAVAIDLHAPWISGGINERIHAYVPGSGVEQASHAGFLERFAARNAAASWPTLRYLTADNDGSDVPTPDNPRHDPCYNSSFMRWCLYPSPIAFTLETPFARNHGEEVTWERLRGFGRSLALNVAEALDPLSAR